MIVFNATPAAAESRRLKARISLAICLAMGTAASFTGVAMAQQAPSAAPNDDQLQEVIVTAERRTVDLQKSAVAVSVRTGDELAQQGKVAIADALEDVPSVVFAVASVNSPTGASDAPSSRISIRGVGSNLLPPSSGNSMVPAVAEYVDGVYSGIGDTYDINRVEVLRGPQGTLYGRSATAGVVAIHTIDPVVGEFNGTATAEFGNYQLRHYTAGINLPLGSEAAVRVSGNDYSREGFYAPHGGAQHTTDGRIKLLVKPTEDLSVLVGIALQSNVERTGELAGVLNAANQIVYTTPVPLGTGHDNTRQLWAQVDWNLGPATLTYLPSLRNWTQQATTYSSQTGTILTNTPTHPYDRFHTQELRLSSNAGSAIKWQTGAFFYDNDSRNTWNLLVTLPSPPLPPGTQLLLNGCPDCTHSTRNMGFFAEGAFPLTDQITLTAGARYDATKVVFAGNVSSALTVPPGSPPAVFPLSKREGTRDYTNRTYNLRLEDNLTASNLLYASVSTAFLPGDVAITTGTVTPLTLSPYSDETLTAFEVGSKNRFLNDRLQVNGALFYYNYGAYQQSVITGQTPTGVFLFAFATSPAKMTGAELELLYQPHRSDRFGLNVSVLNPYYKDKTPLFAGGVAQAKIPGIVPLTVNPSYSHIFAVGDSQTITVQADALYNSDYDVYAVTSTVDQAGGRKLVSSGAHVIGNLSANWAFTSKVSLTLWARNVTNQRFNSYVNVSTTPAGLAAVGTLRDPRTVGVSLRAGF